MATDSSSIANAFIESSRRHLLNSYLARIRRCLELLNDEDIWWRAHETDNSVGNIVLHLCGGVRQQIVSAIGGAKDVRDRPKEFSERDPMPKSDLLKRLEETLQEADRVLASFDRSLLMTERTTQRGPVTYFETIFGVLRHLAEHTGQIVYITKLKKGTEIKLT